MNDVFISLLRCQHGVETISLDRGGVSVNLTRQKCCGQWITVKQWSMNPHDIGLAAFAFTEVMGGSGS